MPPNLRSANWVSLDWIELRMLLDERIGGPGQYRDPITHPNTLCLPLAGSSCRLEINFDGSEIKSIEPGPAFDAAQWSGIAAEVETGLLAGSRKVGRDFSFSSFRVVGSWRGPKSGVQILPPPAGTPSANIEIAEHPFILEFAILESGIWRITNHRRLREHRDLTLLLNLLLAGRTCTQPRQPTHFWAEVGNKAENHEIRWVQQFFFADLGQALVSEPSPPADQTLEEVDPDEYYNQVGHDGKSLRVPHDLDDSICRYDNLSSDDRLRFTRSLFWIDAASRYWGVAASGSFAALVSAIESLTVRGDIHKIQCPTCKEITQHETPGPTRKFKDFLETFAPGESERTRRDMMYSLRSGILHGSKLMQFDMDRSIGWDPPGWNEKELHDELWQLTRRALRNWLWSRPGVHPAATPSAC